MHFSLTTLSIARPERPAVDDGLAARSGHRNGIRQSQCK
jgi:hypothetical protein